MKSLGRDGWMELKDSRAFGTAFDSLVLELVLSQFC